MLSSLVLLGVVTVAQPATVDYPCRDVIAESRSESDHHRAKTRLGACLASRSSEEMHLRVVVEMAERSREAGDERAYCRFGKLLETMLERSAGELLPTALRDGREARAEIACHCDRYLVDARTAGLDTLNDEFDPLWRPRWQPQTPVRTVHDSREIHGDHVYRMLVNQLTGIDRYCVFVDQELRYAESRPAISSGFLESSFFTHQDTSRIHAVVRWLRGDRGETLQIIDVDFGELVRNTSSGDPIQYRIDDGRISYRYTGVNADGEPASEPTEGRY